MNYRPICLVSLVLLSLFGTAFAEKRPPAWETARVISQDFGAQQAGTYAAPIGNAAVAVPLYRKWNVVTVDVGPYRYQWQEQGKNYVILTVNDDVLFYRDDNWFIIVDNKNKKHKFSLISATKR